MSEQQESMFPNAEKIKKLNKEIDTNFARAKRLIGEIASYGKKFTLFSNYVSTVESDKTDHADELILENVRYVRSNAEEALQKLQEAEQLLVDAKDMMEMLDALEADNELSCPTEEEVFAEEEAVADLEQEDSLEQPADLI